MAIDEAARAVDAALQEIAGKIDLLGLVSPVNPRQAWSEFVESGKKTAPTLGYRELPKDLEDLRQEVLEIPASQVDDPLLAAILSEKRNEIDRQLVLLSLRGTEGFLQASISLYGQAEAQLVELAEEVLRRCASRTAASGGKGPLVSSGELERRALAELRRYRRACPEFPDRVVVKANLTSGLRVSNGCLWIAKSACVPEARVDALLHHEIGTHVLTWFNGSRQPLACFRDGLANYDELQEGLGVLAEFVCGGLTLGRLRTLAARVVAVRRLVSGSDFGATFNALVEDYQLSERAAWSVTLRVFRGGGLTKDVVYLRGLDQLLAYLRQGRPLAPLFIGKIALGHVETIENLIARGDLEEACSMPRYLEHEDARARLAQCRNMDIPHLVEETI